jgi:transposase-like protein
MPSLVEYLHDFARRASAETPRLEAELTEIQTRKLDIENKLQAAHLALDRATHFIPQSGLTLYCPQCWILHERRSEIYGIPSGKPRVDLFRCNDCGFDYEIEV